MLNHNQKINLLYTLLIITILSFVSFFVGLPYYQEYKETQTSKITEISQHDYKILEDALAVKYHDCKSARTSLTSSLQDNKITVYENDIIISKIKECISERKESYANAKKEDSIKNLKEISKDNYKDPNNFSKAVGVYFELLDAFAQELSEESNNN